MSHHSIAEKPTVFVNAEHMIVVLDERGAREPEKPGNHLREDVPLSDQKLRFSVTRGGNLKFAKKVTCHPRSEWVDVVDDEGNPVPNPAYEDDMKRYGSSQERPQKRERVAKDLPEVSTTYEVDDKWAARHGRTKVRF